MGTLRSGAATYTFGRVLSILAQLIIVVYAARVLEAVELGRYTVAYTATGLASIFGGLSSRRLAMHREEETSLQDIFLVTSFGSSLAAVIVCGFVWLAFDPRTGMYAAALSVWRLADAIGDISQGRRCSRSEFAEAGAWLCIRSAVSSTMVLAVAGVAGFLIALSLGGLARFTVAIFESQRSARMTIRPSVIMTSFPGTILLGSYLSLVSAAILMVDVIPTLLVANFGTLTGVAIMTPAGRLRQLLMMAASTIGELAYPHMRASRLNPAKVLRSSVALVGLLLFGVTGILGLGMLGVFEQLFGDSVADQHHVLSWAIVAGFVMGANVLVSLGLTARQQLRVQVLVYLSYTLLVVVGLSQSEWSPENVYRFQVLGGVASLMVFGFFGHRSRSFQQVTVPSDTLETDRLPVS